MNPHPWSTDRVTSSKVDVVDADGARVCRVVAPVVGATNRDVSTRSAMELATRIAACANAHDDLVRVLRASLPVLEAAKLECDRYRAAHQSEVERLGPVCKCNTCCAWRVAVNAIAKATGEGA